MPLIVLAIHADWRFTMKKERRGMIFRSRGGKLHHDGFKRVDVHEIRSQFEAVESPDELLALLNKFDLPFADIHGDEFSWMAFIRVQELLQVEREKTRHFGRRAQSWLLHQASDPLLNHLLFEHFEVDLRLEDDHGGKPTMKACMSCDDVLHAVRLANYIDELAGVDFGKCGWCGRLFERTTTHKREFCNSEHAHREGQRRRRAEAKELKDRARHKEPTTKLSKGAV
jgi:hypothetical protein